MIQGFLHGSPGHRPGYCWWCQSPHLGLSGCIADGAQTESLPGAGQQFLPLVVLDVVLEMMKGGNGAVPPLWKGVRLKEVLQTLPPTSLLERLQAYRSASPNFHQPHWVYQNPHEGPRPGEAGRDVGTL